MADEVMALVRWDVSTSIPGVRLTGATRFRFLSIATRAVEILNLEYGEGTHWVEPLNQSHAEWLAEIEGSNLR